MPHSLGRRGVTLLELLIVLAIVSLMVGLTMPSIGPGLDAIRLRSATGGVVGFLSEAMTRAERRQVPVEILIPRGGDRLAAHTIFPGWKTELVLPEGVRVSEIYPVLISGPVPIRSIVLEPGAAFPRVGVELSNNRGQRRLIRIDPVAGTPIVEAPLPGEQGTAK
jgi:prepilin-type N-terminal cleavage/methylation domain-containing protein